MSWLLLGQLAVPLGPWAQPARALPPQLLQLCGWPSSPAHSARQNSPLCRTRGGELQTAVEVLPPLSGDQRRQAQNAHLSDATVANILELVWRDTKMVFSTAQKRPLPVAWELAWERVPVALWFLRYKATKAELEVNNHLEQVRSLGS